MGPWANGTPKMVIGKFVKIMSGCQWIYWRPFLQTNPYNLDHIYIYSYIIYIYHIYIYLYYIYIHMSGIVGFVRSHFEYGLVLAR